MKPSTVTDKNLWPKKTKENHENFWVTRVEAPVQLHSLLQTSFFLQLSANIKRVLKQTQYELWHQ
jgi:hypothetical protein